MNRIAVLAALLLASLAHAENTSCASATGAPGCAMVDQIFDSQSLLIAGPVTTNVGSNQLYSFSGTVNNFGVIGTITGKFLTDPTWTSVLFVVLRFVSGSPSESSHRFQ